MHIAATLCINLENVILTAVSSHAKSPERDCHYVIVEISKLQPLPLIAIRSDERGNYVSRGYYNCSGVA